uniref:Uncharacterized protein n=1 Tax=Anguilla anguilla TaxID=7936 RepID=A0A0E9RPE4_ANGAN
MYPCKMYVFYIYFKHCPVWACSVCFRKCINVKKIQLDESVLGHCCWFGAAIQPIGMRNQTVKMGCNCYTDRPLWIQMFSN